MGVGEKEDGVIVIVEEKEGRAMAGLIIRSNQPMSLIPWKTLEITSISLFFFNYNPVYIVQWDK